MMLWSNRRILIAASCFLLIIAWIFLSRPDAEIELQQAPLPVVTTAAVEQRDIQPVTTLAGKLQPLRSASLHFEVAGRVRDRRVEPGQEVAAGEVLLEIESGDYLDLVAENRARLQEETGAIERDRALLELAQKDATLLQRELERQTELLGQALTSQSRRDEVERNLIRQSIEQVRLHNQVATAPARLRRREAALQQAQRNLDRTRLISPFDAVVNRVSLDVGDYAVVGQAVVDLVQIQELDVNLEIPNDLAKTLSLDQTVIVNVDKQNLNGKIVALALNPDPLTNTHALRVRVDGATLYPGKIARVQLPGRFYEQARVIPATAVLYEHGENHVLVVRQGRLSKQAIRILAQHDDLRIIDGLNAGARVVTQNAEAYSDGQKVAGQQR